MPSPFPPRWALALVGCGVLFFLYFYGLDRAGLLGPDEPRYAAIGQAMAQSGDWVTPRLWGEPWFEKPALLYWMTAAGFRAGLGLELAPRLPVALVSVAFLLFFFFALRRLRGFQAAFFATAILATSAGWLAYSHVAVTDLPMSAAFAAAMLLVLSGEGPGAMFAAGAMLGAAALAKGLAPVVLFIPAVWRLRRRPRDLAIVAGAALLVAAPWYALVTARNGQAFLTEFFWKHHFERYASGALLHVRPVWFYIPVLLAGVFPWTPLLVLLARRKLFSGDPDARFLLAWFGWGFVFFSFSMNKLPGYLLPLLPAAAALLGIALNALAPRHRLTAAAAGASALLACLIPALQPLLPDALLYGLSRTHPTVPWLLLIPAAALAILCAGLEISGRRDLAVLAISLAVVVGALRLVDRTFPVLDRLVSAREYVHTHENTVDCVPTSNRSWRYGLSYYVGRKLPDCN